MGFKEEFYKKCLYDGVLHNERPILSHDRDYYKRGECRWHVELRQLRNTVVIDEIIALGTGAPWLRGLGCIAKIGHQYINGWHVVDLVFKT